MDNLKGFKNFSENFNYNDIEEWLTGDCIPFVVALKDIFKDYNIGVVYDGVVVKHQNEDRLEYNFVHAFCYHPEYFKWVIDARGIQTIKEFMDEFHDIDAYVDWDIPNSQYLIDNFTGKEFYSEETYEYDHQEYLNAKKWIEKNIHKYNIKTLH